MLRYVRTERLGIREMDQLSALAQPACRRHYNQGIAYLVLRGDDMRLSHGLAFGESINNALVYLSARNIL